MLELEKMYRALASSIDVSVPKIGQTKPAAVLVIIYGQKPSVIMTERPKTMDYHPGEISFPGGRWQSNDRDLLWTALRETREEIGTEITRKEVIGQLKPVTTLNSGFTISPFVAIEEATPKIIPTSEIESILEIPLIPLLKTLEDDKDPTHHSIQEMYTFKFQNHLIWGASARILHQIYHLMMSAGLL